MKKMLKSSSFSLFLFCLFALQISATNPDYEQRKVAYIDTALNNFSSHAITLQAYKGLSIDQATLDTIYAKIGTKSTIDFDIVKLVRVLFLTNGSYDNQILNALENTPFWITKDEVLRGYWSENHMIMWMSSNWLLHETYGVDADQTLESRLKHYLQLKIDYGFYEFFSSTYAPYCLSGLLNLADFSQDASIKDLATKAAQRLLSELLLISNDRGVFYPAAGRNYYGKYERPYEQNFYNLIYLLTGFDPMPKQASHSGGFLASSSIDLDFVIDSWKAKIDTIYSIGHSLNDVRSIHQSLAHADRMMFQWSAGCYFHPLFTEETVQFIVDSNLWLHVDFEPFRMLSIFDPSEVAQLANTFSSISKSTVISGQDIAIFKNNGVVLSSIQNFWKGKLGYQQFPLAATIGNTAVFPASGKVKADWNERKSTNANDHLPYVEQHSNVALMMYRGEEKPSIFGATVGDVSLHWVSQDFDEVLENGNWLIGRQDENYIAVRRHCTDTNKGLYACEQRDGQTWVIVVGNDSMYSNFNNFQSLVQQAEFEESWYEDSNEWVYHASIKFDTTHISYDWRDSLRITGVANAEEILEKIKFYPNPTQDILYLQMSDIKAEELNISIHNSLGQMIYRKESLSTTNQDLAINTATWQKGIYFISLEIPAENKRYSQKLIKID